MTALLLTLVGQLGVVAQTKIAVITDTHVIAPELLINGGGTAWQNEVDNDRKLIDYSQEVFDYLVDKFKTDKPDLLLISGDLTKDGEKVSHQYVVNGLNELKAAGVKVYVIPGNHDIDNGNAKSFNGNSTTQVENINSATFASMYADYGYTDTERDPNSLSYACEPIKGLVLLGIDSHGGSLSDATLNWVCQQANKAWKEGKQVIAMMHHPLMPHILMADKLISTYCIANYETVRNRLADAGVRVILTGHMHITDNAMDKNADLTKEIYDLNTGSVISYPCDYRIMTLSEDMQTLDITTESITTLPSNSKFSATAKTRLENSIEKLINDKVETIDLGSFTVILMPIVKTLIKSYVADAIKAAIIHTEGNENEAIVDGKTATNYYIDKANGLKDNSLVSSRIEDALKKEGLTWNDVFNIIHSVMDDKSNYGNERVDKTDDRTLSISMPDLTEGLKLAGDGWSTYCSERRLDLTMTEGITGYIIESVSNRAVQLKEVKVVPAETGFIVNGNQSATLRLKATDGDADNVSGNLLTGTLTATAAPANSYVLSTKNGQTGFFPVKAGLNIPANKAYLTTTTGGNARQLVMPSGETTGISETVNPAAEQSIYTLQGVQVDKASKGIFVKNGKLIIIK